ncbi:hypothetical protein DPEC_G00100570 [Dallia pectoralis]|uniref:Uncharacterized protein n=1 Tax=Dallia pectoralis TaxID=75939 RepID=A0ACC2GWG5_DALPE|nr:hypothetical protein DPEC_G00100570 [Dallia pectoralis]
MAKESDEDEDEWNEGWISLGRGYSGEVVQWIRSSFPALRHVLPWFQPRLHNNRAREEAPKPRGAHCRLSRYVPDELKPVHGSERAESPGKGHDTLSGHNALSVSVCRGVMTGREESLE